MQTRCRDSEGRDLKRRAALRTDLLMRFMRDFLGSTSSREGKLDAGLSGGVSLVKERTSPEAPAERKALFGSASG